MLLASRTAAACFTDTQTGNTTATYSRPALRDPEDELEDDDDDLVMCPDPEPAYDARKTQSDDVRLNKELMAIRRGSRDGGESDPEQLPQPTSAPSSPGKLHLVKVDKRLPLDHGYSLSGWATTEVISSSDDPTRMASEKVQPRRSVSETQLTPMQLLAMAATSDSAIFQRPSSATTSADAAVTTTVSTTSVAPTNNTSPRNQYVYWSDSEDSILLEMIEKHSGKNWDKINADFNRHVAPERHRRVEQTRMRVYNNFKTQLKQAQKRGKERKMPNVNFVRPNKKTNQAHHNRGALDSPSKVAHALNSIAQHSRPVLHPTSTAGERTWTYRPKKREREMNESDLDLSQEQQDELVRHREELRQVRRKLAASESQRKKLLQTVTSFCDFHRDNVEKVAGFTRISAVCAGDQATLKSLNSTQVQMLLESFRAGQNFLESTCKQQNNSLRTHISEGCSPIQEENESSSIPTANQNVSSTSNSAEMLLSKLKDKFANQPDVPVTKWGLYKPDGIVQDKRIAQVKPSK